MSLDPLAPAPDDKDWTWVLDSPCPDCGFDGGALRIADVAPRVRDTAAAFAIVLRRPDAGERPQPGVWSALEYACHVRDVCRVFHQRLCLMLASIKPPRRRPQGKRQQVAICDHRLVRDAVDLRRFASGAVAELSIAVSHGFGYGATKISLVRSCLSITTHPAEILGELVLPNALASVVKGAAGPSGLSPVG